MVRQDVLCARCNDSCYGDVVSAQGKFYHQYCFSCIKCKTDLMKSGYFFVDEEHYCNNCYYNLHGTKCEGCGKYVEGEVISALDFFYHPECFGCRRCGKLFPPDVQIAYDGDGFICEDCNLAWKKSTEPSHLEEPPIEKKNSDASVSCCAGCGNDIKSGQALLALEKQWHLWCFTCHKCGCLLAGEYMGRDGVPYCEQDYQSEFGVTCAGCGGYITGKVLQAGEKHYHPQCSRCAKCGQMFGEGEEMYLQGSEIWHPQCSEEFQREIEENDSKWLADNEFQIPTQEDGPVESSSPKTPNNDFNYEFKYSTRDVDTKDTTYEIKREPPPYGYQDRNNKDSISNGDGNHGRQSSHSSEGSSHTWKPPSYTTATNSKPAGFRSVKPPVTSSLAAQPSKNGKAKKDSEDEEDAPPKPPPPTRTSSNAFRDKYRSGVYSATPFQKSEPKTEPSKPRPLSYIESAAAKKAAGADNKRTTISIYTKSTSKTDDRDEKDGGQTSPTSKVYQRGAGFNKLQARKTLNDKQKANGFGPPTEIDPELRRKLQEDAYLNDREFYQVFQMSREKFYILPKWKQDDMKKKALLF